MEHRRDNANYMGIDIANTGDIDVRVPGRHGNRYNQLMAANTPTKTNLVRLEKDMNSHRPFREQFITDIDIWQSIYSDNVMFKYYTIVSAESEDEVSITHSSFYKGNA